MAASTWNLRSRGARPAAVAALAVLLLLASGVRAAADEPGPEVVATTPVAATPAMALDAAVAAGLLEVEGRHPQSCVRVELVMASRSDAPLTLDVAGRHLRPTGRRVQRLGLAHPVGPVTPLPGHGPGVFAIRLAPRETRRLLVNTCCMDLGVPDPKPDDRYVLASEPTPPPVETVLRWWVDHPRMPQRLVNEAVWKEDPALVERLWDPGVDPRALPKVALPRGDAVRSHGGVLFVRDDRVLVRVDRDGTGRILGRGVLDAFPGGADVVVRRAEELIRIGAEDGAPSLPLFAVGAAPLHELWSVPRGPYLWRTAKGVFLRSGPDGETRVLFPAAKSLGLRTGAVDLAAGKFVVIEEERGPSRLLPVPTRHVVHDVDARSGKTVVRAALERIQDMAAGPAGVFAVREDGALLRVEGREAKTQPPRRRYRRILAVGRTRLALQGEDGGVGVLEMPWDGWVPLGHASTSSEPSARWRLTIDPVTDDVVWIEGRSVRRLPRYATQPEGEEPPP